MQVTLPAKWQTKIISQRVVEGKDNFPNVEVHFVVNLSTRADFKDWLTELEDLTSSSYVIQCTDVQDGQQLVLKQRLVCHHFTK